MNKVYKTVWNALRHCLVVVSEATKSASQRGSTSYADGSEIGVSSPMKSVGFKHSKLSLIVSSLFLPIYLISFEANSATLQATYNQRSTYEGGGTYDSIKLGALAQQKESGGNDESIRKNFYQSFTFNDGDWIVNSGISNMTQRVRVPGFDYYEIQNYITFNNSNVTAKSLTNQGYYTQSGGSAHYSSVYNSSVTYDWLSGSWSYGSIIVTDGDFYIDGNFQSNSKTNYQHTGGSGYIGTLSGSGNISLVNTNYGLGTLSSGAYVNSQNSTLTVETIDLTKKTFTASNTDLITTADQVADYQTDNRNHCPHTTIDRDHSGRPSGESPFSP